MPSSDQIRRRLVSHIQTIQSKKYYDGPINYRGYEINARHSIRRPVRTLYNFLKVNQFAVANVVGIPGSGKTTLVTNMITDLVEMAAKEGEVWQVHWGGAEEIRDLGNVIEKLPKGLNHIMIFDDVSKALEKLKGAEQAEVFEKLTTTRHETLGKLCMIPIYHYTFANIKSIKAQGVVHIYTSATLTEQGNVLAMLGKNKTGMKRYKNFMRAYGQCYSGNQEFEMLVGRHRKAYKLGEPFRPAFVINNNLCHQMLYLRLDNNYGPPEETKEKISPSVLIDKLTASYPKEGRLAIKFVLMNKGYPEVMRNKFVSCWRFMHENILSQYAVNYPELAKLLKESQPNLYRSRKKEKELKDDIIGESRKDGSPD